MNSTADKCLRRTPGMQIVAVNGFFDIVVRHNAGMTARPASPNFTACVPTPRADRRVRTQQCGLSCGRGAEARSHPAVSHRHVGLEAHPRWAASGLVLACGARAGDPHW
jgi:hypothetical protein